MSDKGRVDDPVVDLDRYRMLQEHVEGEEMAYIEVLIGKDTFATNLCIRDLEAIRQGVEDGKILRDPTTDYERAALIKYLLWFTRFMAKEWDMGHLVPAKPEDP